MQPKPTPSEIEHAAILTATETFIDSFVERHRRDRYKLLSHRGDFADKLHHDLERELIERYQVILPGRASSTPGVLAALRVASCSTEAILVGGPDHVHPGRMMPLEDAVDECLGFTMGAIVLLDGGATAFYEPEMGEDARCILTQDPKALQTLRGR